MDIDKKELLKKVSDAVEERRDWNAMGYGSYALVMIDRSDGEVWTDTFESEGSFNRYNSDSIESVPITDIIFRNTVCEGRSSHVMTKEELAAAVTDYIYSRCLKRDMYVRGVGGEFE